MTQKMYKTAQGKLIDMGALLLRNENTRAVGNMKANARGDQLDNTNQVVTKKTEQVTRQYSKQVTDRKK